MHKRLSLSVIKKFKMLIDSLVLSCLDYVLPERGPLLIQASIDHLHRLQNWEVCITKLLRKYDHVFRHLAIGFLSCNWLSVTQLIQYRSLCAMQSLSWWCFPFLPPSLLLILQLIMVTIHDVHSALQIFPDTDSFTQFFHNIC